MGLWSDTEQMVKVNGADLGCRYLWSDWLRTRSSAPLKLPRGTQAGGNHAQAVSPPDWREKLRQPSRSDGHAPT